jgi:hypothetical protein
MLASWRARTSSVADERGARQLQRVEEAEQMPDPCLDPELGVGVHLGVTEPGDVHGEHPEVLGEPAHHVVPVPVRRHAGARAVQQDERLALTEVEVVGAMAGGLDESSDGRVVTRHDHAPSDGIILSADK